MQDIGTLPEAFLTVAACCRTINNRGQVVGFSIDDAGMRAFVWQKNKIKDLNIQILRCTHSVRIRLTTLGRSWGKAACFRSAQYYMSFERRQTIE